MCVRLIINFFFSCYFLLFFISSPFSDSTQSSSSLSTLGSPLTVLNETEFCDLYFSTQSNIASINTLSQGSVNSSGSDETGVISSTDSCFLYEPVVLSGVDTDFETAEYTYAAYTAVSVVPKYELLLKILFY
jgi:hypothetical protein